MHRHSSEGYMLSVQTHDGIPELNELSTIQWLSESIVLIIVSAHKIQLQLFRFHIVSQKNHTSVNMTNIGC